MEQPTFSGMEPRTPETDADWFALEIEVTELFSPAAPVEELELFVGRISQVGRLIDAVYQRGQHAILYGDRGVGKTSLANSFEKRVFAKSTHTKFFKTRCFADNDFVKIWENVFSDFRFPDNRYVFDDIDDTIDPESLLKITKRFAPTIKPVFVFDEFDRIDDSETKRKMAETIKLFSDTSSNATIILVGIGRTISDLLDEHLSVARALEQIHMPRMSREEIKDIVSVRLSKLGMTTDARALENIANLAKGMPGYAHLVGLHSAKDAIHNKKLNITRENILNALPICIERSMESTRRAYAEAVQSSMPNNLFKQALLACALAQQDELGRFSAADVREPFSGVVGSNKEIPSFSRHIGAFCKVGRGPILEQEGSPKNYKYRFVDPMMQTFIIMRAIQSGILEP